MVQWELRLEGKVKARTCKVHQAKIPVLYSGSNGEPLKVLEKECDIICTLKIWEG